MVTAFAVEARLALGQVAVDAKSNEITALPKLLELLSLKGMIVTAAAIHCQRATAIAIVAAEADYALALKGNPGTLSDDVIRFLDDEETPVASAQSVDGAHGRIETRTASISTDIDWLQERHAWPGLKAISKIESEHEIAGKTTTQTCYDLLSTAFSPERRNAVVRGHWAIEHSLHWVLDVVMDEDSLRNRRDHGPENLAMLRHLALNLAKLEPSKGSIRGKLKRAGWDDTFLAGMVSAFNRLEVR